MYEKATRRPTASEIKEARLTFGLSQTEAARIVSVTLRCWQYWENGKKPMSLTAWELFRIKTGLAEVSIV